MTTERSSLVTGRPVADSARAMTTPILRPRMSSPLPAAPTATASGPASSGLSRTEPPGRRARTDSWSRSARSRYSPFGSRMAIHLPAMAWRWR